MVQAINLKKGMIFSQDGKLIKVLKANHHKPGKGNTVMQMDLRDVKSGAVVHKTMRPTEKVDLVEVTKKRLNTFTAKVILILSWILILMINMKFQLINWVMTLSS